MIPRGRFDPHRRSTWRRSLRALRPWRPPRGTGYRPVLNRSPPPLSGQPLIEVIQGWNLAPGERDTSRAGTSAFHRRTAVGPRRSSAADVRRSVCDGHRILGCWSARWCDPNAQSVPENRRLLMAPSKGPTLTKAGMSLDAELPRGKWSRRPHWATWAGSRTSGVDRAGQPRPSSTAVAAPPKKESRSGLLGPGSRRTFLTPNGI